jgi:GNAT superfamily N-acetyltransferase
VEIVRATPELAAALTRIALAAKRHWRYPERWIELWTPELTVTGGYLAANPAYAAVANGEPVAFYGVVPLPAEQVARLDHLWVRPDWIGRGLGRTLFEHAVATAAALGARRLVLDADPYAEPFYRHMGARCTGERIGEVEGQRRSLPIMELELAEARDAAGAGRAGGGGVGDTGAPADPGAGARRDR